MLHPFMQENNPLYMAKDLLQPQIILMSCTSVLQSCFVGLDRKSKVFAL